MKLIAKKPCSFGGRNFFIDQEIPQELVTEPATQERLGIIAVIADEGETAESKSDLFTQEQVDEMLTEKAEELRKEYDAMLLQGPAEGILAEGIADVSVFDGKIIVPVVSKENGDDTQGMSVPLTGEQVQQVFSIMQMNVPEAEKAISEVAEEDVLIVLHACDSRSKVKKAAKNRADTLISTGAGTDAQNGGNEATDHAQEADNQPSD